MRNILSTILVSSFLFTACTPAIPSPAQEPAKQEEPQTNTQNVQGILVTNPQPNDSISFPLTINGEAEGPWYFEGVFSVKLLDANDTQLAFETVTAQGDWMTPDMVPFTVTIAAASPATATGKLVFEADNPSGLAENAKSFEVPVSF